jgi:serine/threonine-protein kinase
VVATVESVATGVTYTVDRRLRHIPAGGSEQYAVSVAVDATVAAGSYPMKPVAFSDSRPPEETRSEGPAMTLVVPEKPVVAPVPWWRKWWWLLVLGGVLLLIAIIVGIVLLTRTPSVAVPSVVGTPRAQAEQTLQNTKLATHVTPRPDVSHAADVVIDQNPAAGVKVKEQSTVELGTADNVVVPDVGGQQTAQATAALQGSRLTVTTQVTEESGAPAGTVLRTEPPSGTRVLPASGVTLVVATQQTVNVPGVVGQLLVPAQSILRSSSLDSQVSGPTQGDPSHLLCRSPVFFQPVTECTVVGQTPGPGQRVPRGSSVTLFVRSLLG